MASTAQASLATSDRRQTPGQRGSKMSRRKSKAVGSLRTADSMSPRLLALSQPHHLSEVDVSESLFAYGDGIALLQHGGVGRRRRAPPAKQSLHLDDRANLYGSAVRGRALRGVLDRLFPVLGLDHIKAAPLVPP